MLDTDLFRHNEELHNSCPLSDILRMINSEGVKWSGYVEGMREKRTVYQMVAINLKERDH
jgi:hypothetical protein